MYKIKKKHLLLVSVLLLYVIFLQIFKVYSPITYLFNIATPTTGVTRAFLSLLKGNIKDAFNYHHLFFLAPALAIYTFKFIVYENKKDLNKAIVIAILFFIYNLYRIFY